MHILHRKSHDVKRVDPSHSSHAHPGSSRAALEETEYCVEILVFSLDNYLDKKAHRKDSVEVLKKRKKCQEPFTLLHDVHVKDSSERVSMRV